MLIANFKSSQASIAELAQNEVAAVVNSYIRLEKIIGV